MNEAAPSPAIAPTPTPAEMGAQMARRREQFNLSQQEVSERLHIRARYVSAIEDGRYELMPGKVYARGYVHTYAEFLGLNPEQVVAQCFAGELPSNAQPIPPIAAARHRSPQARMHISTGTSGQWRGYAVMGAVVLVVLLIVSQFTGHDSPPEKNEATVAPVPEAMLATVRTLVMPLPDNYACLTGDALFACFNADRATRRLDRLETDGLHYGGTIDVSTIVVAPASSADDTAAPESDAAPAEANPDSPVVATPPDPSVMDDDQKHEPGPPHD